MLQKFIASSTLSPMCNNFAALSKYQTAPCALRPNCPSTMRLLGAPNVIALDRRLRTWRGTRTFFPPDASTSNAKSTIAYSFTKKEKKKVSTTERERKKEFQKALFSFSQNETAFVYERLRKWMAHFLFDIVCEFRHPQMLLSSPSLKKLFFIVVRKEGKSKKDIN